jgi:hypothetical protein
MINYAEMVEYIKFHWKNCTKKREMMYPVAIAITSERLYILHGEIANVSNIKEFETVVRAYLHYYSATSVVIGSVMQALNFKQGKFAGSNPILYVIQMDTQNAEINRTCFNITRENNRIKIVRMRKEVASKLLLLDSVFRILFPDPEMVAKTFAGGAIEEMLEAEKRVVDIPTCFIVDPNKESIADGNFIKVENSAVGKPN